MEKLSSCQNRKKNVMVRLLRDFTKIILKKRSFERKNKQEKHSVD